MTDNKKPLEVSEVESLGAGLSPTIDQTQGTRARILGSKSMIITPNARRRATELRKATRYELNCAAIIRWLGSDGAIQEAIGTVCDISTCGVFIQNTASLQVSNNVEIEIVAPGLRPNSPGPELRFEGNVVRSEKSEGKEGIAVAGFLSVSKRQGPVH
jgi:hypothetical protein